MNETRLWLINKKKILFSASQDDTEVSDKAVNHKEDPNQTEEEEVYLGLKQVVSAILEKNHPQSEHLKSIASDILIDITTATTKPHLTDSDKLHVIKSLADLFIDLRLEPQFQLKWLLAYIQVLERLKADSYLRSAFARWAWTALAEVKVSADELAEVEPDDVVKLAHEIAADYDWFKNDTAKVNLNCDLETPKNN